MIKIAVILILFFLSVSCFGQKARIINKQELNLRSFENWAKISHNDSLTAEYSFLDSLQFFKIRYQSDNLEIDGFIVQPKPCSNTPIVIFNRGGNRDYYNIGEMTLLDWIAPIARHGFSVFASQYREKDEFGGADINDVLNLIEAAKNHPDIDSTKIGMVGWSRGGLMTYIALAMTNEIDCAIIGGAPTDLSKLIHERPKMNTLFQALIPNFEKNKKVELEKRSPLLWTHKLNKTGLLLMHGKLDEHVDYSHSVLISEKLNLLGYPHTLSIFENEDHILRNSKSLKDNTVRDWLIKNLNAN